MPILRLLSQVITQVERGLKMAEERRDIEVPESFIREVEQATGKQFQKDEDGVFHLPVDPRVVNRTPIMPPGAGQLTTRQAEDAFNNQIQLAKKHTQMSEEQREQLLKDLLDGDA